MMEGYDLPTNPIDDFSFGRALEAVQQSLSLIAVLRNMYGAELTEHTDKDGRDYFKTSCELPSLVPGFAGTCHEQDGASQRKVKIYSVDAGYWRWICFSCGRKGDVVDYLRHRNGWELNTGRRASLKALRHAAQLAGVTYLLDGRRRIEGVDEPVEDLAAGADDDVVLVARPAPKTVDVRRAHDLNFKAAQTFVGWLGQSGEAKDYLRARGVTDEQTQRYGIGVSRKRDSLYRLIPEGDQPFAEAIGLLRMTHEGQRVDRHIGRVVFPYMMPAANERGFVVTGFAGRQLRDNPKYPKWMHAPNVHGLWEKGSALLGLYQAAERAKAIGRITVCEGGFDVLALDRLDIPTVAVVGAALTVKHATVIERLGVERVTLAVDGDPTGRGAVIGAVSALVERGFAIEAIDVVDADDGEDPATTDPETLRARWENPTPAADFMRALGVEPPKPDPARDLKRLFERLATELDEHTAITEFESAAEFRLLHERENHLRAELARVRDLLAKAS